MKKVIYIFLTLTIFTSCNGRNEKFDQNNWKSSEGIYNGNRISMVNDLIKNHLTFGMEYGNVQELLGEPNRIDRLTANKIYELEEKYGEIDPIGYKYLELEFDSDEKLTQWKITETGFKE